MDKEKKYYLKQRSAAILMLICSAVPVVVSQDGTAFLVMLPFCIWMGVTKTKVFIFDDDEIESEEEA